MSEETEVYCPRCLERHLATITIDANGYPHTRWSEAHDPDAAELARHRDAIRDLASSAFVLATSRGQHAAAEYFLDELFKNEEDDG